MKNNFGSKLKNWLLGNDEDDEEDFLDPILEERRKEKVSTPVSYQAPVEEKKPAPALSRSHHRSINQNLSQNLRLLLNQRACQRKK